MCVCVPIEALPLKGGTFFCTLLCENTCSDDAALLALALTHARARFLRRLFAFSVPPESLPLFGQSHSVNLAIDELIMIPFLLALAHLGGGGGKYQGPVTFPVHELLLF